MCPQKPPQPEEKRSTADVFAKRMKKEGIDSPVTEPTDWCSPMIVVPKNNNTVRICADF